MTIESIAKEIETLHRAFRNAPPTAKRRVAIADRLARLYNFHNHIKCAAYSAAEPPESWTRPQ